MIISLLNFSVPKSGNYCPEHSLVLDVFSGLKTLPISDAAAAWNAGRSLSRDGHEEGAEHLGWG